MWVIINGYKYPYRINEDGEVQKCYLGEWIKLKVNLASTRARVNLRSVDGKRFNAPVVWLMADAFMGGRKSGYSIIHINGSKLDNRLVNLKMVPKKEACIISSDNRRKPVEKIDRYGNPIEIYRSVTEAAKKNFISKSSVGARCRNEVKDPFHLADFTFRYEKVPK